MTGLEIYFITAILSTFFFIYRTHDADWEGALSRAITISLAGLVWPISWPIIGITYALHIREQKILDKVRKILGGFSIDDKIKISTSVDELQYIIYASKKECIKLSDNQKDMALKKIADLTFEKTVLE